jgi:hypothetical protein
MIVMGLLHGGSWLLGTAPRPYPNAQENGPYRDSTTLAIWSPLREGVTVLGTFPNFGLFAHNGPGGTSFAFDVLTANTSFVPVGTEVWVGVPEREEVVVLDDGGRVVRHIRVPLQRRVHSDRDMRVEMRRHLAQMKDAEDSARTTAMFDQSSRSSPTALFSRILAGGDGKIWFEAFHPVRTAPTEYVAVDRQGRVLARMVGPPGVRFVDIGLDYALGIRIDSDDVETVVLYRMNR